MLKKEILFVGYMILVGVLSRLLPHPWNFTAIGAMAVFCGSKLLKNKFLFVLPVVSLFISDLVLGLHNLIIYTYIGFLATSIFTMINYHFFSDGSQIQNKSENKFFSYVNKKANYLFLSCSLMSSLIFFVISNFGVWMTSDFYQKSAKGLIACYFAALPFLENQIIGDLFYSVLFLVSFELLSYYSKFYSKENQSVRT